MSVNLAHHQIIARIIDLGYVRLSSQNVHIPYEEAYGKGYKDIPGRIPTISKTKSLLNFNPSTNIDQGMQKIIGYYYNELVKANKNS